MDFNGATIELLNWEKFNPRKDLKASSWFRLQNSLFEHEDLLEFSDGELLSFVYLLTLCSKKQNATIKLNTVHATRIGRRNKDDLFSALQKLEELQMVRITLAVPNADVTSTLRGSTVLVPLRTNERDERNETNETIAQTSSLPVIVANAESQKPEAAGKGGLDPEGPSATALTWRAYKAAYAKRHGNPPPWNPKLAGQLKSLTTRMPSADAPAVAAFYVSHPDRTYVNARHPVGMLLRDAEKLYTEWVTGQQMTSTTARLGEKTGHAMSQLERIKRGEL